LYKQGSQFKSGEELSVVRQASRLHSDFEIEPFARLSDCSYGAVRVEGGHQQKSEDHGSSFPHPYSCWLKSNLLSFLFSLFVLPFKQKKKVKFPEEFDALDIVTDELNAKIKPVSTRLKEIEKEREERRKVRKKMKAATTTTTKSATLSKDKDVEMADATQATEVSTASSSSDPAPAVDKGKGVVAGELEDERTYREKELKELEGLVSQELRDDIGCSYTGQYELVGAVSDGL
jgi:hypothetical protein